MRWQTLRELAVQPRRIISHGRIDVFPFNSCLLAEDTDQSQSIVKGFGPKVQSAWIGGDADEFNTDIGRKLVPKYIEFALALTGVQVNLTKSSDTASSGDKKGAGLAQGFSDLWQDLLVLARFRYLATKED
jgi:hypothetical protein